MSGQWNPVMPTQSELTELLGAQLIFINDKQANVPFTLAAVNSGTPMNDRYLCYSAVFEPPPEMAAFQGTYRLYHSQDSYWDLFLTPIKPTDEGISQLEAVFHVNA